MRLALARLKDAGMLETRSGSGTYLSATARNATGRLGMIVLDAPLVVRASTERETAESV